jgi:TM2 domain-containing membrane protein YozV
MYSIIGPDGQTYGPADLDTVKSWCLEGRINSDTMIVDPIDGHTKRAVDLPEVAQHIRPPTAYTQPVQQPFEMPNYNRLPAQPYQPVFYTSQPKSKLVAILLAIFLGALGIHRFYLGHIGVGLAMLLITVLTAGWLGVFIVIWAFIDVVLISTGALRDSNNRALTWP